MRYCKRCRMLYSSFAAACPRCGVAPAKKAGQQAESDPKTVRRDWIWLAIGIPLLIAVMYLAVYLVRIAGN